MLLILIGLLIFSVYVCIYLFKILIILFSVVVS